MRNGDLTFRGRPLAFIGSGMSRLAYSDGNGTCVKIPVKGRERVGVLQNRAEAECLAAGDGYGVFPKLASISRDGKTLAVEECRCLAGFPEVAEAFRRYNEDILRRAGNVPAGEFGCGTALQRVAWGMRWLDRNAGVPDVLSRAQAAAKPSLSLFLNNDVRIAAAVAGLAASGAQDPWSRLVRFWDGHRDMVVLQEAWHDRQWGARATADGLFEFVVVDAGFSRGVQSSEHYQRDRILLPPDKAETGAAGRFCGRPLSEVFSPKGAAVAYSFKTSRGSEYVLAKDRMSQRVKKAGLPDDGLHRWMDRSVFVTMEDLSKIMDEFRRALRDQRPVRLVEGGRKWLALQTLDSNGEWYSSLRLSDAARAPVRGRHVCEFMLDDGNVVKAYHPGHDVTEVTEVR